MKLGVNERLRGKKLYAEKWRDIEGYEGLYQVSNIGRVRSLDRYDNRGCKRKGQIKKGSVDNHGYLLIGLSKNGKRKYYGVHRLVAFAFVEGYFEGAHIDHIDTCKTKNIWTNLRWTTAKENNNNPLSRKHNSEAHKGKHLSEEHKKKISEGNKGKTHNEETKSKISEANKGRTHNEETKSKISEANSKKVICVETKQIFNSIKEASEYIGVVATAINNCLRSGDKTRTSAGFHWAYYEEEVNE